ncbi:MAG: hypothetical protein JW782_06565 [Candidatus Saganbacteria bacterium]|nr:hypothetical protein [Candidatus Saganbacteria bacterium]
MTNLSLNVGVNNSAKEYAVRQAQQHQPKPQQEAVKLSEGMRESGFEWVRSDKNEMSLASRVDDAKMLLTTSATDTSAKVARSGNASQELLSELKNRFKKTFVSAYSNVFSHNRLLAKVSEWLVGNVMEKLALMGISPQELEALKGQVRTDLICQNRTAMEQVVYDETMLEIVG